MICNSITTASNLTNDSDFNEARKQVIIFGIIEDILFLVDVKFPDSFKGTVIYSTDRKLLGMVMAFLYTSAGKCSGFTICLSLHALMSEYFSVEKSIYNYYDPAMKKIMESMVIILYNNSMGTGVIVDYKPGITITCSHVVNFQKGRVNILHTDSGKILDGTVIYSSLKESNYDLAVIRVAPISVYSKVFKNQLSFSLKHPLTIGNRIYLIFFTVYLFSENRILHIMLLSRYA